MTVSRRRKWAVWLLIFLLGFTAGGYAMRDVQPRSFLAVDRCNHCWSPSEIAGLVGAIVMQRAPGLVPLVVLETDRTIAIRLPTMSRAPEHFVIVPKRDIRDAARGPGRRALSCRCLRRDRTAGSRPRHAPL